MKGVPLDPSVVEAILHRYYNTRDSTRQIGKACGVSRGAVSGVVYRHQHAGLLEPPPARDAGPAALARSIAKHAWPAPGTILFHDDPRARGDHGSPERLSRPDPAYSLYGCSTRWATA